MTLDYENILNLTKENSQHSKPVKKTMKSEETEETEEINQLSKQKIDLERKIRVYVGEDPLEPHYEYATWLEQNCMKLGGEHTLLALYENIIEVFRDQIAYKQDDRFVEILVKFITQQADALKLFQLVYEQGLGKKCFILYQKWAEELDKNNDFKKADQVYQLGIRNQAQPLKKLSDSHIQFQLSLARRLLDGHIDASCLLKLAKNGYERKIYDLETSSDLLPKCKNNQENIPKSHLHKNQFNSFRKSIKIPLDVHEDTEIVQDLVTKIGRKSIMYKGKKDEFKCPTAIFEAEDLTKKPMYPKHLVYINGSDIQLEEIMAACYFKRIGHVVLEKDVNNEAQKNSSRKEESEPNRPSVESNLIKSAVEEHSWCLKTEFIKPLKLPVTNAVPHPPTDDPVSVIAKESFSVPTQKIENLSKDSNIQPILPQKLKREIQSTSLKTEDEALDLSSHANKGNTSSFQSPSSSMTVNTREVLNMVDKWWRSPSAPPHAKIRKSMDDFEPFKKPVSRKSQFFKMSIPTEEVDPLKLHPSAHSSEVVGSSLPFTVFKDESMQNCISENEDVIREMTERTTKTVTNERRHSSDVKKINAEYSNPPMESLKINTANNNETPPPLVLPIKLAESPVKAENKENLLPHKLEPRNMNNILGIPMDLGDESGDEDHDLFDETCSTKAFSVQLPSSTPFARSNLKRNRRSSIFNVSYTNEIEEVVPIRERKQSFGGHCKNPVNLSLILENSKEQGLSSSGGNSNVPK